MNNVLWAALIVISSGCGDASGRVGVSGHVAFSGNQSIDRGIIEFSPLTDRAMMGTGAPIVDGFYQIPRKKGLVAGKYRVRIYSPEPVLSSGAPPGAVRGVSPPTERVAKRFNAETELVADIQQGNDRIINFEVE